MDQPELIIQILWGDQIGLEWSGVKASGEKRGRSEWSNNIGVERSRSRREVPIEKR